MPSWGGCISDPWKIGKARNRYGVLNTKHEEFICLPNYMEASRDILRPFVNTVVIHKKHTYDLACPDGRGRRIDISTNSNFDTMFKP